MESEKLKVDPYMIIRAVSQDECNWLGRTFIEGEIVFRYFGATFNCISKSGFAFTSRPNEIPFFQLPKDSVVQANELLS